MSLFLLLSPLFYLGIFLLEMRSRVRWTYLVRYCFSGIIFYIPIYILLRIVPDVDFFSWNITQVFWSELAQSREAYLRIASILIVLCIVLGRYYRNEIPRKRLKRGKSQFQLISVYSDELFCWLLGYFMAANIHIFLLLGPFPSEQDLFFWPLSRIFFIRFSILAFKNMQLTRHPRRDIRNRARIFSIFFFFIGFYFTQYCLYYCGCF